MDYYMHLSLKERRQIYLFLDMKLTVPQIAQRLGRHRSTIAREIKRNATDKIYLPGLANRLAQKRTRQSVCKITTDPLLHTYLFTHLKKGWSPEQIAGRLRHEKMPFYACHETIYRYIYAQEDKNLFYLLPYKKPRRHRRYQRIHRSKYLDAKRIQTRPEEVNNRQIFGHWEGDTLFFNTSFHENVTTLVERKTRFVMMAKNSNKKSDDVMTTIRKIIQPLPRAMWKTLTFDRGVEFTHFKQIEQHTACAAYYCDPHSPWQRGSNENMNGRLRRFLPRRLKVQALSTLTLKNLADQMNCTPRKCLGFLTPREALFLESFGRT